MVIGAGKMPLWEFMAANALGAVLWSGLIAMLGYAAGHAVVRMLGGVAGFEKALLVLAVVAIVAAVVDPRCRAPPGAANPRTEVLNPARGNVWAARYRSGHSMAVTQLPRDAHPAR